MASTFTAAPRVALSCYETLGSDDVPPGTVIPHIGYDTTTPPLNGTYVSAAQPDVTGAIEQDVILSSGSATLDLTSGGLNNGTVSLSGLKPRGFIFKNPIANANAITVQKGASNGYTGLGSSFSLTVQPGWAVGVECVGTGATAISSSVKTLDFVGTGSQTMQVGVIAGPT